jgi:hypothetical protein
MLFGVAVVVFSLLVSILAAVVIDTAHQAILERRWRTALPLVGVVLGLVAVAGVTYGALIG